MREVVNAVPVCGMNCMSGVHWNGRSPGLCAARMRFSSFGLKPRQLIAEFQSLLCSASTIVPLL